jgi:hypothetical protein
MSVLGLDIGIWLARKGCQNCEPKLRENLVEIVEDLVIISGQLVCKCWCASFGCVLLKASFS